ncbi:MAG: hypothetical protein LQ343_004063 [Gyalolechia ehrenbergii]|nr:MAG: hypothetical protein LQ343_004063 [Gyalolechia ehrenbergii]
MSEENFSSHIFDAMPSLRLPRLTATRLSYVLRSYATRRSTNPPPRFYTGARSRLIRDPQNPRRPRAQSKKSVQNGPGKKRTLADALRETSNEDNSLLSPVHIPEDPHGHLKEEHPAASILANSGIVIQRQLELMNVMIGFEQANKYVILDPQGNHVGFIAEQDNSMGVYDPVEVALGPKPTSRDVVTATPDSLSTQVNQTSAQVSPLPLSQMPIIGEAHQQWAPLRRKYNLYLFHQSQNIKRKLDTRQIASNDFPAFSPQQLQDSQATQDSSNGEYTQFAYVDEPFLSWDFSLRSAGSQLIGSVNRNWGGIGRELFTDTGVYALRMDAAGMTQEPQLPGPSSGQTDVVAYKEKDPAMTLDQRAVMLATAVSIDFDYFSRHSSAGGGMGWMPLWFPMGGGEAAAADEVVEGAGAAGKASGGSIIEQDGAAAGATAMGTMGGYEAMQRGAGRGEVNDALPMAAQEGTREDEETTRGAWGDPGNSTSLGHGSKSGGDGGDVGDGGGGGGGGFDVGDFFDSF